MDKLTGEVVPILILCVVIALVVARLPKVDVGHTAAFRRRRVLNWLPLGLTYAFLYMGRYNLQALKNKDFHVITGKEFGDIDAIGAIVYGLAFLLNGPMTDRFGGRRAILLAAAGAAVCNMGMGMIVHGTAHPSIGWLTILFALNMYFQSFGAVAIVKVNASWFHLRERGTFGGIFGILISLGLYLAFDWAPKIAVLACGNDPACTPTQTADWLFFAPAAILVVFLVLSFAYVRDTPADAGLPDFDVADASSGDTSTTPDKALVIIKRMLTHKVILTIAFISLCSGFVRQGILKWFLSYAGGVNVHSYVREHWGMMSCVAGMCGGMFAGTISDHLFQSRRPPVSVVLFSILLLGAGAIAITLTDPALVSWIVMVMAMAVIGVHGMLSGVASQDFGGRKNAGTATGLIDGFVYFGTALQGFVYGRLLPELYITVDGKSVPNPEAAKFDSWYGWPLAMLPMAFVGLLLSLWIIKARVHPRTAAAAH
ncbi:MAG: MFS transporter [Deltaproteobacteria bacterium]|nr:MFS transporter [Deltaproteobacteria bacterium]